MQQQVHRMHPEFSGSLSYTPMRGISDNRRLIVPVVDCNATRSSSSPSSHHGRQPSSLSESSSFDGRSVRSNSDIGSFGGESNDHWSVQLSDEPLRPTYYHPQISDMEEVFEIMGPYSEQEGCFLVRNSFSKPGALTISVIHEGGVKHFNVVFKDGTYSVVDKQFQSLNDLVKFYGDNDVPNLERIGNIRLKFPIKFTLRRVTAMPVYIGPNSAAHRFQSVIIAEDSLTENATPITQPEFQKRLTIGEKLRKIFKPRKVSSTINGGSRVSSHSDPEISGPEHVRPVQIPLKPPAKLPTSVIDKPPAVLPLCTAAPIIAAHSKTSSLTDPDLSFSDSESARSATASLMAKKPAAPLPSNADSSMQSVCLPDESGVPATGDRYYSAPRDLEWKLSDLLIANMQHEEICLSQSGAGKCECGLNLDEAELPRGWSLHLSTSTDSAGRVFFTGPDGRTSWNLPLEVSIELDPEQQDRIRSLLDASEKTVTSRRHRLAQDSTADKVSSKRQPSITLPDPSSMIPVIDEDFPVRRGRESRGDVKSELRPVAQGLRRLDVDCVFADLPSAACIEQLSAALPSTVDSKIIRQPFSSRTEHFV